jgi:hypothetical protein
MGSASGIKAKKMAVGIDEILPSKSTIHWSEHDGVTVPVTCNVCEVKRRVQIAGITDGYLGRHPSCVKATKYSVGFKFKSGARIVKREKNDGAVIKCSCGYEHQVLRIQPRTTGLCSDCGRGKVLGKFSHLDSTCG